ncbi:unnamed protein product [Phytomonas sp. EM1]|nr:unnamed protein product [Phytomonas sp. EM1]|eukprot:CCW62497.1 unnamed protein product [Phytomonas sp. isolate EM1]
MSTTQPSFSDYCGKDTLFRPIDFVRYRKPHVVSYPRHAIVLNPQHTQQQRDAARKHSDHDGNHNSNSNTSDDENDNTSDSDDDPRRMDKMNFLCSSEELRQCMHLRWKSVEPVGVGLANLGNTCFMNAVLQAISYTPALAQYFTTRFKTANTTMNAPYDFAYALGETIRQMTGSAALTNGPTGPSHLGGASKPAYRPSLLASRLPSLSKRFRIGTQSDAHEFIVQLLSACEKSVLYRLVGPKKLEPRVALTTALFQIYGGYLRSQVSWSAKEEISQLQRDGKHQEATDLKLSLQQKARNSEKSGTVRTARMERLASNTYDPMTVLHLEMVGQTLEQSLAAFCEPEKLSGRCYLSPREVNVHATKQMTIHIPPNVLIIHLKRFQNTGGKVNRYIRYPLELDLSPYLTESVERAANISSSRLPHAEGFSNETGKENNRHVGLCYELNAVCIHEGGSIHHGHYYAVVRAKNGMWYLCDDARVSPISVEKALSQQAYLLFYSRIPMEEREKPKEKGEKKKSIAPQPPSLPFLEENWGVALSDGEAIARLRARRRAGNSSEFTAPIEKAGGETESQKGLQDPPKEEPTEKDEVASNPEAEIAEKKEDEGAWKGWLRVRRRTSPSRSVVAAVHEALAVATPVTLQRPAGAPKFQQRVRDPMWEMEMDRGRVKKVRSKLAGREDGSPRSGSNPFQAATINRFDWRGRQLR